MTQRAYWPLLRIRDVLGVVNTYRLGAGDGHLKVTNESGGPGYEIRWDGTQLCCTCPGFASGGRCKHRDALAAFLTMVLSVLG